MALTDPSDWPRSMPDLRTIDNLLRCSICFEYLNVAMILPSCSHNYCSLCIRRYLKYKRQCPSCNMEVSVSELCNNRTLDELVKAFVIIRPYILTICKQAEANPSSSVTDVDRSTSTQRAKPTQMQVATARQSPKKSSSILAGHFKVNKCGLASSREELGQSSAPSEDAKRSRKDTTNQRHQPQHLSGGSPSKQSNSKQASMLSADGKSDDLASSGSDDDVIEIDKVYKTDRPVPSSKCRLALRQATHSHKQDTPSHVNTPSRRQTTPNESQTTPSRTLTTPSGSQITPSRTLITPSGNQPTPSGNQPTPSGSQPTPSASQTTPSASQTTPSASQTTPSGNQPTPSGSQTTPSGSRDKAECPVCGVPVPTKYINAHLDACLKRSEETQTNKRVAKRKRISALVWKLVPDRDLKKRMKEYNLSTKGKRHELVKRLDEYILRYNAQCDAANPKSGEEIAKEVERMEQLKTQPQQLSQAQVHTLKIERGDSEDQIYQSKQKYLLAHKNQFGKLVSEARQRMQVAKKRSQKVNNLSGDSSSSQDAPSTETSASPPEGRLNQDQPTLKESAVVETEEVIPLEGGVSEGDGMEQLKDIKGASSPENESSTDAESNRIKGLILDGSVEEGAHVSDGSENLQSGMDTSESHLHLNPDSEGDVNMSSIASPTEIDGETVTYHPNTATEGLMVGFSRSEVHLDLNCRVLAPSSPSVASKDGNDECLSQQMLDISSERSNPTPDHQELLCIPESPLAAVAETRRRKRKTQDCGSSISDSGSSLGDGEPTLRRSKRERKNAK